MLGKGGQKNTPPFTQRMSKHVTFDKQLEEVEEQVQREQMNAELMASFAAMADDDDYGERDGDEGY